MQNLYELTIDEEYFINSYNNFDYFLTNPVYFLIKDIEGVYETKLPLDFKLITNLGIFKY